MNLIDRKISVHLQDFPDVSFITEDQNLVSKMDLVRRICSTALSIRDHKNLRVRLPLSSLSIIGTNSSLLQDFKEIIADEVNVKEVITKDDFTEFAELKLQINFKKIGAKFKEKVKEINDACKNNKWQKIDDDKISIAGVELTSDEYELKLSIKNYDQEQYSISALDSNDFLVILDIKITEQLADEGIARDIVRAIQQNRKDANLNISSKINLSIFSSNSRIIEVSKLFDDYIKEQVLANQIKILNSDQVKEKTTDNSHSNLKIFNNQIENGDLLIIIDLQN
jgi:isoleucyl-tRNA synthetase